MPSRTAPPLEPYVPPPQTKENCKHLLLGTYTKLIMLTLQTVDWASLEALDLSLLSRPGGKQALAEQVLSFINKNGTWAHPAVSS
jgi:hypothetical protein